MPALWKRTALVPSQSRSQICCLRLAVSVSPVRQRRRYSFRSIRDTSFKLQDEVVRPMGFLTDLRHSCARRVTSSRLTVGNKAQISPVHLNLSL